MASISVRLILVYTSSMTSSSLSSVLLCFSFSSPASLRLVSLTLLLSASGVVFRTNTFPSLSLICIMSSAICIAYLAALSRFSCSAAISRGVMARTLVPVVFPARTTFSVINCHPNVFVSLWMQLVTNWYSSGDELPICSAPSLT